MSEKLYCSEDRLLAKICRNSFYDFVKEFWEVIIPEKPIWNWHIKYLCDELQIIAERVFKGEKKQYDLIINIPPGMTKSTICSQMFSAWIWTRMPTARILGGSHTLSPVAMDHNRKAKDIVKSEKYQRLFDIYIRKDQDEKGYFILRQGGGRIATGSQGSIIGTHYHFQLIDDPIDPKGVKSEAELLTTNQWMSEVLPTRKVDKEVSVMVLIMQRLHENDPTGYLINKRKNEEFDDIKHIVLPAEINESVNPPELKKFYVDGLLDPVRLNRNVLKELRRDLTSFSYAGQMDQSPVPREGGMFAPEHFVIVPTLPDRIVKCVRYWDKAATAGGGCNSAGVKIALLRDNSYIVLDVTKGQWNPFKRNQIIKQTAELDGKQVNIGVEQEPGSGGKESALISIQELASYKITADRPIGNKALRAEPFSCQVNAGNVYLLKGAWNEEYISECRMFPNSTSKDQVDASSAAFAMLANKKGVDYKKLMKREAENVDTNKDYQKTKSIGKIIIPEE